MITIIQDGNYTNMKKFIKRFFYHFPRSFIVVPFGMAFGFLIYPGLPIPETPIIETLLFGFFSAPFAALFMTLYEILPDKIERKHLFFIKQFRFLIEDYKFKISDDQILGENQIGVETFFQAVYINDFLKITIMLDEKVRIIIQNVKTLSIYYDEKEFCNKPKNECTYKEKIIQAKEWLINKLKEDLNVKKNSTI